MESMSKRTWRAIAAGLILIATVIAFISYLGNHPEVHRELKNLALGTSVGLLALYFVFIGSLAGINDAALRICKTTVSAGESLLLTMYSSVINFFGPLQSGPAFRALYLKQKHGVSIKKYTRASFVYYLFYAVYSLLLLFSNVLKWWLLPLIVILILLLIIKRVAWTYMALATLLQVVLWVIIFYVELQTVSHVSLSQVLVYTGAANLALFVSLTPGAIGFRESFLLFSQRLHHIDTATIVAANTIDRAIYIVLLIILAIGIFATHANRRLKVIS